MSAYVFTLRVEAEAGFNQPVEEQQPHLRLYVTSILVKKVFCNP